MLISYNVFVQRHHVDPLFGWFAEVGLEPNTYKTYNAKNCHIMIFEIMIKSYPIIPVWLSAQCHLDALQPVSEQEPGATSDSSSAAASGPGAPPAPRWQRGSRRHLLGRVLLDRWLQWEDRGGGPGWPCAPSSTAAGIWGALYCGMWWWFCLHQKYSCDL